MNTQLTTQQNTKTIEDAYAAFGRGDIPFLTSLLTTDVSWFTHCDSSVPWGGDFSGIDQVPNFFKAIYEECEVLEFSPDEFVVEGNTVVSTGYFACKANSTGKTARAKWIFVWKFRDGKVCSYEQFQDPSLAEAFKA